MKTFQDKEQSVLIRKFHALLRDCNMDAEDKAEILFLNGVSSSKDLSNQQLNEICAALYGMANPGALLMDKLRKRLMACIGDYLKTMDYKADAKMIKAVACRAASVSSFNEISETKLRALYNAFIAYKKAMVQVAEITSEILTEQSR